MAGEELSLLALQNFRALSNPAILILGEEYGARRTAYFWEATPSE